MCESVKKKCRLKKIGWFWKKPEILPLSSQMMSRLLITQQYVEQPTLQDSLKGLC